MSKRLPNGLAWTLLGLTVALLAANVVLGLTGGVGWAAVFGFIPITLSFALVGALIAARAGNRLGWFFLAGAISVIVRYRRSGPEQRQQLKWFVYAAAISALIIFVAADFGNNPLPEVEITVPLIPVAVGIAIFKYRLYDIDRLISRTLAYAIVTALLVGVYAGLVILAGVLGFSTPPAVAIGTLAAAALFSPLRQRVQRAVDKRFNRVRYDAELTVAAFATRLRDAVDLDTVRAELLGVVDSAVQPAHISIWTAGRGPE
jgi:hypothetical protein